VSCLFSFVTDCFFLVHPGRPLSTAFAMSCCLVGAYMAVVPRLHVVCVCWARIFMLSYSFMAVPPSYDSGGLICLSFGAAHVVHLFVLRQSIVSVFWVVTVSGCRSLL